jgi:WD40 repeat protein
MRNTKHQVVLQLSLITTSLLLCGTAAIGQSNTLQSTPGAGKTLVHSKFGGQIFGFDIDQNGTEGVLSEALFESNGNVLAAVETFNQKTGQILKVISETQTQDDFITLGVVGNSVGLVEHEHVAGFLKVIRSFHTMNPLSSNKFTGLWTPPIGTTHLIEPAGVSRSQGEPNVAVFAYDNSGNFIPWVFSSNFAANTFGPVVQIADSFNFGSVPPPMAYDATTNQAILGGGDGCFGCLPVIGLVDLTAGTFSEFTGFGFGFVNGIAVDAADGIFCTTTEDDATVEFYNLSTQTGIAVVLPNSGSQQIFSGADVEFDPIHKLFLIAQPVSSSAASGSTIYVYTPNGELKETLNGFNFSNTFNVVAMHIALHPSQRSGYVDGPDSGVTEIQSFTY